MSKFKTTTKVEHIGNGQVVVTFHYLEWDNDLTHWSENAGFAEHRYEILFVDGTAVVVRRSRLGRDNEVFMSHWVEKFVRLRKVSKRIKKYLRKDFGAAILVDQSEIERMALVFNERVKTVNEFSDGMQVYDPSELEWSRSEGTYLPRELVLRDIIDMDDCERNVWDSGLSNTSPKRFKEEYSRYNNELGV